MTPAEVAALRERLIEHREKAVHAMLRHGVKLEACALADDLRAALALLDAQAAEIARLTAEREQMRAEIAAAHRMYDAACDTIRALAPATAAEVAPPGAPPDA